MVKGKPTAGRRLSQRLIAAGITPSRPKSGKLCTISLDSEDEDASTTQMETVETPAIRRTPEKGSKRSRIEIEEPVKKRKGETSKPKTKNGKKRSEKRGHTTEEGNKTKKTSERPSDNSEDVPKSNEGESPDDNESSDEYTMNDSTNKEESATESEEIVPRRKKQKTPKKDIIKKESTKKVTNKGKEKQQKEITKNVVKQLDEDETEDNLYLMKASRRSRALKINYCCKGGIMDSIKAKLGEKHGDRFRETCFGHFLDFSITKTSSQLLLHLIQRLCKPKKASELNFYIGGKILKFGIKEFALVTGLNCGPLPQIDMDKVKGEGHIRNVYFEGEKSVTRKHLNLAFKVNKNAPEDDTVKMALLYCLESFLLPHQDSVHVEMDHILMVDDDELFNSYPWGRVAFDLLIDYMKKALESRGMTSVGMGGFICALLVWAYEVIPTLSTPPNSYARRIRDGTPRIINWEADMQPEWRELGAKIFDSPTLEMVPMMPTDDELNMSYMTPFLPEELESRLQKNAQEAGQVVGRVSGMPFLTHGSRIGINERLNVIEKKQDELVERQNGIVGKLDVVMTNLNMILDHLKTSDELEHDMLGRFVMRGDVSRQTAFEPTYKGTSSFTNELDNLEADNSEDKEKYCTIP